ncbi:MAG TPA: GAF domain-containing protein [Steroidobacteraceae bacterium]
MDTKDLQILRLIDEGTAAQTGVAFFREFVQRLAQALDSRYAFASRFDANNTRAHVIAWWDGTNLQEGMEYPLPGSPCENVLGGDIVAFNSNIAELFPVEREALEAMGAQSYLAIPLKTAAGRVIGHLAVIDTAPKNWQERDFGILRIFAARCAAELERQSAEQEMQRTNQALSRRLELEALVAETSTRFMNIEAEGIDAEIERTLDAIGRFIGSDRGMIFMYDDDASKATLRYVWPRAAGGNLAIRVPVMHREDVPEVLDYFLAQRMLNASRPEKLPPGFAKLDGLLGSHEVVSRIAVPMVCHNRTIGILGFHSIGIERAWPDEDLRLLRLLAEIVSSALSRRETAEALRLAKNAAEAANRAKTEFLANMSHELRTPLNGILGYAQLLRRDPAVPPDQRESVAGIESCGEHLLTLISEILDLAKIESGRLQLDLGHVDLDTLLREVADVARVRATQSGLMFTYQTATRLPAFVLVDGRKLRQILLNLLGNAVKFTDHGSVCFRVAATRLGGGRLKLKFDVEDTGIGIASADLETIFDPFHQVRPADRAIEGTGLGLAISRKLTMLLGGALTVRSERGKGATFTVELEVEEVGAQRDESLSQSAPVSGYEGPRRRILIADDKADNRHILSRLLKSIGFDVDAADNGAQAVALAQQLRPDLIFMDLVMPIKDGFAAIREIRELPTPAARVPIVAVSASAFENTRVQSVAAGCDDFITKPVRLDHVVEVIGRLLELTWRRGHASSTEFTAARPRPDFSTLVLPPALARELYELALSGDVQRLSSRLKESRRGDQATIDAVDALASLAADYDTRGLRAALRPMAERAS